MVAAGLLLFLLPVVWGRPATTPLELVVRSQRPGPPSGFSLGHVSEDTLRLTIAMTQPDLSGLQAALLDVSHPSSAKYGRHLSKHEVEQFAAPRPDSTKAVMNWLTSNGITPTAQSGSGDTLDLELPIARANVLLAANFTPYVHDATNMIMTRTLSYSLPAHLHEHIAFVYPTTQFTAPTVGAAAVKIVHPANTEQRSSPRREDVPASCDQRMTPSCLQALYNIPSAPATAANNSIFVGGFNSNMATQADLSSFLAAQRPDFPNGTLDPTSLDGTQLNSQSATIEGSLDVQYTAGLATNVSTTLLSSSSSQMSDFVAMAQFLLKQDQVPLVLSTSAGFIEEPDSGDMQTMLCNYYMQLGARGTTVIFSTGDNGVAGNSVTCFAGKALQPSFPASCPYVTAVGSTANIPETAASFSGGGFSNTFTCPDYQKDAVAAYLQKLNSTNAGLFDASGRAYPDVSMQGVNFAIKVDGQDVLVNGTSASAPAFASVVALLNDQLLNAGKSPLGFLNPLLYSSGVSAFNDITTGSNPGCGTEGFQAAAGWDPVTGLGAPDFDKLLSVVSNGTIHLSAASSPKSSSISTPAPTPQAPQEIPDHAQKDNGAGSAIVPSLTYFVPLILLSILMQ
ncbi:subtilisin-like protein [Dichomitus squalens]|uniref:tripeptidyl-peptidase II n=1 Tax=Dichomitus squalens TaxID=114155 RepID=A0A4Q9MEB8_9APHY|nr:subtilisin-like protein [Dichomitus squalens]